MANTNDLRNVVEPSLKAVFFERYQCERLEVSTRSLKYIFEGMEPDLLAIDREKGILYVGEITTSGYLGPRKGNFHHGTVKKVYEAFGKFYLMQKDSDNVLNRFSEHYPELKASIMSCHFIMPAGAAALTALGYREKLFKQGVMTLDELPLPIEINSLMCELLKKASAEMTVLNK